VCVSVSVRVHVCVCLCMCVCVCARVKHASTTTWVVAKDFLPADAQVPVRVNSAVTTRLT
jgi:hypothetical protein